MLPIIRFPLSDDNDLKRAVAVAIEVLSPDDRFTRVIQKCRKYAEWGIQNILVFDPANRKFFAASTPSFNKNCPSYHWRFDVDAP
jgi:Uma2 family endonuclease